MLRSNLKFRTLRKNGATIQAKMSSKAKKVARVPYITHSAVSEQQKKLFTDDFLIFVRTLAGDFYPRYVTLLQDRKKREGVKSQREDLAWIRNDPTWKGPPIVPELEKRWVEITGPAGDRKMFINALNSGANIYMTDLEDSQSPAWSSIVNGYQNIHDAVHGQLSLQAGDKNYTVNAKPATLVVRPRGIHMFEKHVVDESGRPIPAGLLDIASYIYHNGQTLVKNGSRPLLYQPKLESFGEAVLIHDIVQQIEKRLDIPYGTTRITALIETVPGILQAEEIGFGLGKYWAGLNCGRWDYIFSFIKNRANDPTAVLPDRGLVSLQVPFLTSYVKHIVQVCHKRGVHAMGGMSAFIPSKDASQNAAIFQKVEADKQFELSQGCDGAWVAHPGMVESVSALFNKGLKGAANQINSQVNQGTPVDPREFFALPADFVDVKNYTENGLRTNVSVGVKYIASWLEGTGAAGIGGLMEDLATAEISRMQVWQWLKYQQKFTRRDGSVAPLSEANYRQIFDQEVQAILTEARAARNEDKIATITKAAEIFDKLVTSPTVVPFIQDVASDVLNAQVKKPLPLRQHFKAVTFTEEEKAVLKGTQSDITLDARLATVRGERFNKYMATLRKDGLPSHGSFIGTPNGHSARNVVEGGLGESWPYIGGWELNARGLALGQPMPDTLAVSFHEQGDLAVVINRFLEVADRVQELDAGEKLAKFHGKSGPEADAARQKIIASKVDYLSQPMLADLEQGWGDPKKVFLSVIRCLQNGVNMMHIEDQYSLKRCGHLGGKGLDDINGWVITFRAANLGASIFDQVHLDGEKQNVNFVARTDALSAEFIQYSHKMHDASHPDHPFIDWERGFTADGRYLYLKKGVNPETGIKRGIEHSARRCAEIVKLGLASHVWMETPNAEVEEARLFMNLVNAHLAPHGVFARGLYNHSPSFVWDVSFFIESQDIAKNIANYIKDELSPAVQNKTMTLGRAQWLVKEYLKLHGDRSRGDYDFNVDYLGQILANGLDYARGEADWKRSVSEQIRQTESDVTQPSLSVYKTRKELQRILNLGFRPLRHITNTIVAQRLVNFKNKMSDAGFEAHLVTLPLYPSDAHTASELARGMTQVGIHDFVKKQRAARKYADSTGRLTSFFHQKATGTGWEVTLNKLVGTTNTDILEGSTEVADHAKEQSLRDQNTGPSTFDANPTPEYTKRH